MAAPRQQPSYLHWEQRPPEIKETIHSVFSRVKVRQHEWGLFNGDENESYDIAGINEYKALRDIIKKNPDRKDFYFCDAGAGAFASLNALAYEMKTWDDLPVDVRVHAVGVRGEIYTGEVLTVEGQCYLYHLGAFEIENIIEQFKNQQIINLFESMKTNPSPSFEHLFDVIVSRWTLRHLVDPLGTLLQLFRLARPETGLLMIDGLFCLFAKPDRDDLRNLRDGQFYNLLVQSKIPFLTRVNRLFNGLSHYIIKKPNKEDLQLPCAYTLANTIFHGDCHAKAVLHFSKTLPFERIKVPFYKELSVSYSLYGDADMFASLQKANAITKMSNETLDGDIEIPYGGPILETPPKLERRKSIFSEETLFKTSAAATKEELSSQVEACKLG